MRILLAVGLSFVVTVVLVVGCSSPPQAEPCGPSTCDGCCSLEGECLAGSSVAACGSAGAACVVCIANQFCNAGGSCQFPLPGDAGVDTDGGSGPDAGSEPDAGIHDDGGVIDDGGLAIVAPEETWTWVDFPDAVCGNGSATGIGVNLTSRSEDVLIYMEGGGACWDEQTCFLFNTASNLHTGYGASNFDTAPFKNAFAVDRTRAENPFRDMSYVYIPYCTGDVHAGDAVRQYGSRPEVHHRGGRNVDAFLRRLVPTFPNAGRVFVSGSSAGGFGAQLNYERIAAAFPNAEVHVFADSAQMITPASDRLGAWLAAWNLTLPAGCADCTSDFTLFPEYLATTYPDSRFALTVFEEDAVLGFFFGYNAQDFRTHTLALLSNRYDPHANARYFQLSGTSHTMLGSLGTMTAPDGTTLRSWAQQWVDGSAGWDNVKPSP